MVCFCVYFFLFLFILFFKYMSGKGRKHCMSVLVILFEKLHSVVLQQFTAA